MDRGLIEFIHTKIMAGNTEESIRASLRTAGIDNEVITDGFVFVRKQYPDIHQDIAASHNFFPPLRKKVSTVDVRSLSAAMSDVDIKEGFFAGRLRRRDFIFGLILVPGVAITFLAIVMSFLQIISPDAYKRAIQMFIDPTYKDILLFLVLILPFIIKTLDLAIRRLHDVAIIGVPAVILISPIALLFDLKVITFGVILGINVCFLLFLLLKRGTQGPNKYGEHYPYHGGFLRRIFHK